LKASRTADKKGTKARCDVCLTLREGDHVRRILLHNTVEGPYKRPTAPLWINFCRQCLTEELEGLLGDKEE